MLSFALRWDRLNQLYNVNSYKRFSRRNRKTFISWTPIVFYFKQFSEKYDNYRSIVFSRVIDCLLRKIFVWLLNLEETRYLWARCIFHRNFIDKWDANINRATSRIWALRNNQGRRMIRFAGLNSSYFWFYGNHKQFTAFLWKTPVLTLRIQF